MNFKPKPIPSIELLTDTNNNRNALYLATEWVTNELLERGFRLPFVMRCTRRSDTQLLYEDHIHLGGGEICARQTFKLNASISIPFECHAIDKNGDEFKLLITMKYIAMKLNAAWETAYPVLNRVAITERRGAQIFTWVVKALEHLSIRNPDGPFEIRLTDDDEIEHFATNSMVWREAGNELRISDPPWEYWGVAAGNQLSIAVTDGGETLTSVWTATRALN